MGVFMGGSVYSLLFEWVMVVSGGFMILSAFVGDITKCAGDAIVNAAKQSLEGGGGVDGAVHAAAGPELHKACLSKPDVSLGNSRGPIRCPTGEVVVTEGFNLPAKYIFHTVAPIYKDIPNEAPKLLASCYRESIRALHFNGLHTIYFPALGTGIYGYPLEDAICIAVKTCIDTTREFRYNFASKPFRPHINFVCFDTPTLIRYCEIIQLSPYLGGKKYSLEIS
jgi:O-acetyl-ADP-ribose deacetylase (regulator of RNase III)